MANQVRTEFTDYIGHEFLTTKGYIRRNPFTAPLAASATRVLNAHAADGTTQTPTAQPDVSRTLQYVASGAATGNVTVNGKDNRGNVISETKQLNGTTAVHGATAFASITNVVLPSGAYNVSVGIDVAFGLDRILTDNSVFLTTVDGAADSALPTVVVNAALSKNTVTFATAPNGSHNYVVTFVATEIHTDD